MQEGNHPGSPYHVENTDRYPHIITGKAVITSYTGENEGGDLEDRRKEIKKEIEIARFIPLIS